MSDQQGPHSPLPWRVELDGLDYVKDVIDCNGEHAICFGHDYDDPGTMSAEDAAFIVKAVNLHDELVAALRLYVDHYGDPLKVARAVLAKADAR
jgi:hypothetical protein